MLNKFQEGFTNISSGGSPKFRISTYKRFSGTVNPIQWEKIEYKHQIEYRNGAILILKPGWYTFTANLMGPYKDRSNSAMHMWLVVDNTNMGHGYR